MSDVDFRWRGNVAHIVKLGEIGFTVFDQSLDYECPQVTRRFKEASDTLVACTLFQLSQFYFASRDLHGIGRVFVHIRCC